MLKHENPFVTNRSLMSLKFNPLGSLPTNRFDLVNFVKAVWSGQHARGWHDGHTQSLTHRAYSPEKKKSQGVYYLRLQCTKAEYSGISQKWPERTSMSALPGSRR